MGDALLSEEGQPRAAGLSVVLLTMVWFAELVLTVRPVPGLSRVGEAALAGFVLLALARASGHIRALSLVVFAASAALAAWGSVPAALAHGFERSQIFGAFLPSVLLLRATAEASPRLERMRHGLGSLDAAASQNWTLYGSHALGAVLSVGAMSIVAPVVARGAAPAERRRLAATSARGVGTAVTWSPFFVAIAFTSQLVPRAPVWEVMSVGAGLGAIGLALSQALFTPQLDARGFRASVAELRPLLAPMAIIVAAVVSASALLHLNGLQAVTLVVPLFCAAYLATLGADAALATLRRTFASFARLADEMLIVVSATMLAAVVSALPAVRAMGASMTPGLISGFPLLAALVFALVALGLAGLHPMIGAGILLPVLASGPFGITPVVLVSGAVFAWALSASISMWTLPVVAASIHFGVPVRELMTRRSLLYGLLYAAAGVLYLGAVNAVSGGS